MSGSRYTPEQQQFIKDNYLKYPVKTLARMINGSGTGVKGVLNRNNLVIPKEIIEQRKKDSQFLKGSVPANKGKKQHEFMTPEAIEKTKKTRFKKGQLPHNTKYNGYERVTKDGYVEIRVKRGVFRLKHIVEWEKVNGKIPKDHCLWCKNGNKQNTHPSNWELITRKENIYRNVHNQPPEIIRAKKLITLINKNITP